MTSELRHRTPTGPASSNTSETKVQTETISRPTIGELKRLKTVTHFTSAAASTFYTPPSSLFFLLYLSLLVPIRVFSALYTPIQDCDETFNYWEPTHYLSHHYGLQTWEYSPVYAIRSWLYISLHALVGSFRRLLPFSTKVYTPIRWWIYADQNCRLGNSISSDMFWPSPAPSLKRKCSGS